MKLDMEARGVPPRYDGTWRDRDPSTLETVTPADDDVKAAVLVVAVRIARVVLHVADEDVVPVDHVERAVGRGVGVDRAEAFVGGGEEFLVADDAAPGHFRAGGGGLAREARLHRAHMRGRAHCHLPAAAHLVVADAQRVFRCGERVLNPASSDRPR